MAIHRYTLLRTYCLPVKLLLVSKRIVGYNLVDGKNVGATVEGVFLVMDRLTWVFTRSGGRGTGGGTLGRP